MALQEMARDWWSARRLRYNVALGAGGVLAFLAYARVLATRCAGVPEAEITILTSAFQAAGFLVAMAIANVFYNLGPFVEMRVRSTQVPTYRRWAFGLGLGFSVTLPLSIPILVAISGCRGP
jgi:hypothetical protein